MSYNGSTVKGIEPDTARGGEGMKGILDFLKKGDEELQLSPYENIVLLLGNTGAGKSTVAQYIAGDMEQLLSQEVEEDAGEFVIIDQNNRISRNSTILSQTVVPYLIRDPKNGTIYYDCPGFSDTRSAAHEIGATYFIKKILDTARSVKLVFVVSHHSVRKGVDRKDFMLLLKHAVDFIKAMDKYKDSIALIVTKVENIYTNVGSTPTLVPDENVIRSIAKYIDKVKDDLKRNPELLDSGHSHAMDFLEALIFKENDSYQRIGIFRRPDKAGPISNIEPLKYGKQILAKIINDNIEFKKIDVHDFGYTLSPSSKIHINDLIEEINKDITNELVNLGEELIGFYVIKEEEIFELDELEEKFKNIRIIFTDIQNLASEDKVTSQKYLRQLRTTINDLKINVSDYRQSRIEKQEQYINFLRYISNQSDRNDKASQLTRGLSNALKFFYESEKWYNFLNNLYSILSKYEIQKNIIAYNSDMITSQLSSHKAIKFNERKFLSPLGKIITDTFKSYRDINDITLNRTKQKLLIKLLDMTLNHEVSLSCPTPSDLFVKGRYVKLSDVSKGKCAKGIKFIYIYGTNKVFLDTSLDLIGKEIQLAIVAPIWEVIGTQHIVLDGISGPEHSPAKAAKGYPAGSRGEHGRPGNPGGPAGSFFGMGTQFVNEEQLSISANGGNGGRGQIGGDGSEGTDAKPEGEKKMYALLPLILYNEANYKIMGQQGGDGGHGGVGGYGGYKGKVTIVDVGSKGRRVNARISTENGFQGSNGEGGRGGLGGRVGDYTWKNFAIFVVKTSIHHDYERTQSGRYGESGRIGNGMEMPWEVREHLNPMMITRKYEEYSKENFKENIKRISLLNFLNEINYAEIDTRMKRNSKYYELGDKDSDEKSLEIKKTIEGDIPSSIDGRKMESITFLGELFGDNSKLVSSGSSSVSKHSLINGILDLAFAGLMWLGRGDVDSEGCRFGHKSVEAWTMRHYKPLPSLHENNLSALDPKYANQDNLDWNSVQPLRLADSYGNFLLWDLLLKKLTGNTSSVRFNEIDDYEMRVSFASNLAYRHYIP